MHAWTWWQRRACGQCCLPAMRGSCLTNLGYVQIHEKLFRNCTKELCKNRANLLAIIVQSCKRLLRHAPLLQKYQNCQYGQTRLYKCSPRGTIPNNSCICPDNEVHLLNESHMITSSPSEILSKSNDQPALPHIRCMNDTRHGAAAKCNLLRLTLNTRVKGAVRKISLNRPTNHGNLSKPS